MKTSLQLKAKSRVLSSKTGIPSYIIQRNYFLERFLERVSLSCYRNSIVLKGGVLVASILGIEARSTIDLDATMMTQALSFSKITEIVDEVLQTPVDDGVHFTIAGTEEIGVEADYPGCRVTLNAVLDNLRDVVKLDFTADDAITPKPVEYGYRLMFEDREISILVYNLETVLAEKLIAVLSFDIINTRMKDFYDIHMLLTKHYSEVTPIVFAEAINNTARQRHLLHLLPQAAQIVDTVANSDAMMDLWRRYRLVNRYAAGIEFTDTIIAIKVLCDWMCR